MVTHTQNPESTQHDPLAHDDFSANYKLLCATRESLKSPRGFLAEVQSCFFHVALLQLLDKVRAEDFAAAIAYARAKADERSAELAKPAIVHAGSKIAHFNRVTLDRTRQSNWCNLCQNWYEPLCSREEASRG